MHAFGIIIQLASLTFLGQATPDAPREMLPAVELTSRLDEVALTASGAVLTRIAETELPAGLSRLRIIIAEDPSQDVLEDFRKSCTVFASGAEILQHTIHETKSPPDETRLESLRRELDLHARDAATAEESILGGNGEIELLESVARTIAETRVDLDSDGLLEMIESINMRRRHLATEIARQQRILDENLAQERRLAEEIEDVESGTRRIVCEIIARSPGDRARFSIQRRDEDSSWSGEVEVDWNSRDDSAQVRVLGRVRNGSGTDWDDVRVALDTGPRKPTRFLEPLADAMIDVLEQSDEEDEITESLAIESAPPTQPDDSAISGSRRQVFTSDIPISLRRGDEGLVLLARFKTGFQTSLVARPMGTEGVHQVGALRNTMDGIIPAGRLRVIKDGLFFANSTIPMIEEKTDFQIPLGIKPGIVITRRLISREEVRTGLLNGGKLTTLSYRISIKNLDDQPCRIRIEDRIPTSATDDIEVALKESTPEPAAPPDFDGTVQWVVQVPAEGAQSVPETIEWEVTIAHSADLEITDIIE